MLGATSHASDRLTPTGSNGDDHALHRRNDDSEIAGAFDRIAALLEAQHANPFRVAAYRRGARTVRQTRRALREIYVQEGLEGLEALPGVGAKLATTIRELLETGRSRFLEHLEGQICPEELLSTVPGIGPVLAHRLHHELHIDTLEDLEIAAHDGRLETLEGFSHRRTEGIREVLDSMLRSSTRRRVGVRGASRIPPPPVGLLLEVDNDYRVAAELGVLRTIAPRRFNPDGLAWLPILHTERDGWDLTAMYSNSARAHKARATHDWVVILFSRDGYDGQRTVVTETGGSRAGERVVRGRELECAENEWGLMRSVSA